MIYRREVADAMFSEGLARNGPLHSTWSEPGSHPRRICDREE